ALVAVAHAEEPAGDQARLQGCWSANVGPEKNITITLTIKGNAATFAASGPSGEFGFKGEIRVNETVRPYKTIDWINLPGPAGQAGPTNRGIYRLSGDSLTICNGGGGNERPTEFKAGKGGPPQLFVLNRDREPAAPAAAATASTSTSTLTGDQARLQGRW